MNPGAIARQGYLNSVQSIAVDGYLSTTGTPFSFMIEFMQDFMGDFMTEFITANETDR